jgi:fructokinase
VEHPRLSAVPAARAVGIGELLWDLLPFGPRLGGAPFNLIAHLTKFGVATAYLSAVGRDDLGRRALAGIAELGVSAALVEVNDVPTGTVRVTIDVDGTPAYEIVSPAAYEMGGSNVPRARTIAADADLIVFGTLAMRFSAPRAALDDLIVAAPAAERLYDVNLRRDCWTIELVEDLLRSATVVKLNEEERNILASELALPAGSVESFASDLKARYALRAVCVTRGPDGACLLLDSEYAERAAPRIQVADTVGAGDAFAAALAVGLIEQWGVADTLSVAVEYGSFVATREGAIPSWRSRPERAGRA